MNPAIWISLWVEYLIMIAGVGTDIVDIARIAEKVQTNQYFKEHVFSADEIAYCDAQRSPAIHFAGRWAAKEAYLKAFGVRFIGNHRLSEIEILRDESGKPYIHLKGKMNEEHRQKLLGSIHVSISHTDTQALGFVVIEGKEAPC